MWCIRDAVQIRERKKVVLENHVTGLFFDTMTKKKS